MKLSLVLPTVGGALVCCMLVVLRADWVAVATHSWFYDQTQVVGNVSTITTQAPSSMSPSTYTVTASLQPSVNDAMPRTVALDPNVVRSEYTFETCVENCQWRNKLRAGVVTRHPCKQSYYCASKYDALKMLQACTLLCRTQYPARCDLARFLIFSGQGNDQGMGSYFLSRMSDFQLALSVGRVFVDTSTSRDAQRFTHAGDPDPSCAARNFRCYFVPLTNCSLPREWRDYVVTVSESSQFHLINASQPRFIVSAAASQLSDYLGLRAGRPNLPAEFPLLGSDATWWWTAQFVAFSFRPNAYMLRTGILPLVRAALAPASDLPARYMNVFMRQGDKWKEAKLRSPEEYFERIRDASTTYNISACYLSSDSAVVLNETLHLVRTKLPLLQVFYLPFPRKPFGLTLQELVAMQHTSAIRPLVDLVLADLFITARAHYWIGTASSYYCVFQDAYRKCAHSSRFPLSNSV